MFYVVLLVFRSLPRSQMNKTLLLEVHSCSKNLTSSMFCAMVHCFPVAPQTELLGCVGYMATHSSHYILSELHNFVNINVLLHHLQECVTEAVSEVGVKRPIQFFKFKH